MKRSFKLIAFLIVLTAGAVAAQKLRQSKKFDQDKAAIREVVGRMEAGWNLKDADHEKPIYLEDVDYVNSYGTFIKGRDAIAEGHRRIFSTVYKNTTLTLTIEKIRLLDSDAAVVHALAAKKQEDKISKGWLMMVLVKKGKEWKITAQQITSIQEPPQTGERRE